ncbi:zinc-ribbon and DUF3426 domain-containing protein [Variovorax sp. RTB1]|uniref:zinc-ribbon and DUF3426 domain-containing protein n=1 Tax=Variovorax sp. RTB1 TaxID=3048631 RepID=UPI002B22AC26|nr:zinc-ribbon and DUF3426 domain-containing protein [Variovorax sp. RTB1]MEB0110298.1 zinc-ribbon and DUF3426 domain-containing protein [Variovorax sp. RTB1]
MSLVTRCPSCATTFKVVKDQLRISDGWVRCGRCSHVFDASLDLQELPEPAVSVPAVPASAASVPSPPPLSDDADFFDDEPLPEPVASAPAPLEMPEPDFDDDDVDEVKADEGHESDLSRELDPSGKAPEEERQPYVVAYSSETVFERRPMPMPMPADELNLSEPPRSTEPAPFKPSLHAGAIVLPRTLPGLPSIGLVADEPWPQVVTPQSDNNGDAPTTKSPLIVPSHLREQADNASQVQFQKALRRARDKAAKIARSREKSAAAQDSNPMPLVQSESDAMPLAVMSATAESAPVTGSEGVTLPGLLRAASAPTFWHGVKGRALLVAGVVLGVLLLTVQVLRQERDAIVARQPGMRSLLSGVCAITGCQLSALRQIGDVTIDGAAFAREKVGDGYRLSFTLRNAASVPLAMPAIELSLLDTQEQAVIRRVLLPADFGAPAELAARGERVASMPLALDAAQAASLPPVAGYRLVAFYP